MYPTMPLPLQDLLENYTYRGVAPVEVVTPNIRYPFVAGLISDMKVPAYGPAKILEFGGVHSRLRAYPAGELTAIDRMQRLVAALDLPVTIINHRSASPELLHPSRDNGSFIGGYGASGAQYGFRYQQTPDGLLGTGPRLRDLRTAQGLAWCLYTKTWPSLDPARYVSANPQDFSNLIREKREIAAVFERYGLTQFRPQSWALKAEEALDVTERALAEAPQAEWFVLKPTTLSRGRGVTVIHRHDLVRRLQAICLDPAPRVLTPDWPDREPPHEEPVENWLRFYPLLLEELVKSSPVPADNDSSELYDGTLRVCFLVVSNLGRTLFVPFASYWKLPPVGIAHGIATDSMVSDIKGGQKALPVEPADLQRAFPALPQVIPAFIEASQ